MPVSLQLDVDYQWSGTGSIEADFVTGWTRKGSSVSDDLPLAVDKTQVFLANLDLITTNNGPGADESYVVVYLYFANSSDPNEYQNTHTEVRYQYYFHAGWPSRHVTNISVDKYVNGTRLQPRPFEGNDFPTEDDDKTLEDTETHIVKSCYVRSDDIVSFFNDDFQATINEDLFAFAEYDTPYLVGVFVELWAYCYSGDAVDNQFSHDITSFTVGAEVEDGGGDPSDCNPRLYKVFSSQPTPVPDASLPTVTDPPPKICTVNTQGLLDIRTALHTGGVSQENPQIPIGYMVITADGWEWFYTGTGWVAKFYNPYMDMRDEEGFTCP